MWNSYGYTDNKKNKDVLFLSNNNREKFLLFINGWNKKPRNLNYLANKSEKEKPL